MRLTSLKRAAASSVTRRPRRHPRRPLPRHRRPGPPGASHGCRSPRCPPLGDGSRRVPAAPAFIRHSRASPGEAGRRCGIIDSWSRSTTSPTQPTASPPPPLSERRCACSPTFCGDATRRNCRSRPDTSAALSSPPAIPARSTSAERSSVACCATSAGPAMRRWRARGASMRTSVT